MPAPSISLKEIFAEALRRADPGERSAYLDLVCPDPDIRGRVEALLRASEDPASFLDADPEGLLPAGKLQTKPLDSADYCGAQAPDFLAGDGVGTVIAGRYKLLEKIGEGGMGTVWVAEQSEPVKRKVALKLIKAGMDSRSVLARFEAERQALALMDHPNIAKVLDGGMTGEVAGGGWRVEGKELNSPSTHHPPPSTPYGRPFFVMEYFKGIPITEYCDAARLSVAERLQLFVQVCSAVQHAHQKGIIHRDLKPSNILVAPYDDKPVPKVIDFGLAKAIHQSLTEKTLHTAHATVMGTPLYMSPEQAQLNNLDVDTRSDIYSLGVLLYELLTGTTPLERKRVKEAAWDEVRRIIREEDPPRPSARLTSTDTLPSLAACRQTDPKKLTKQVRGELDWIVMKALDKDRRRRYETANGLARDIDRYLSDEVVEARPPSAGYRLRKFVRRHRGQVIAASLVLFALLAGIAGTTYGLIWADQQREVAEAEKKKVESEKQKVEEEKQVAQAVRDFLQNKLLGQADTETQADALLKAGGSSDAAKLNPTIRELLDRAADELTPDKIEANFPRQPKLQAELLDTVGKTYYGVGEYRQALSFLTRAAQLRKAFQGVDDLDTLDTLENLANAYRESWQMPQAIELYEQVRDARVKKLGAEHRATLTALYDLAGAYLLAWKLPQAIELYEHVRDAQVRKLGADHSDTLSTRNNLAVAYLYAGKLPQALQLLDELRDTQVKKLGPQHPNTLTTLNNVALAYQDAGKLSQAIELFEKVRDAQVQKRGADHPITLVTMENLGVAYLAARELPQAFELFEKVRDARVKKLGADHPSSLTTLGNLAAAYLHAGEPLQAIKLLEQARDGLVTKLGADHPNTLSMLGNLASAYMAAGKLPEAIELLEKVRDAQVTKLGADHPHTFSTLNNLALAYQAAGKLPQAIELFEQGRAGQEKKLGADHPNTLLALNNMALAYLAAGKLPQAFDLFEQARVGQVKKLGADHRSTLTTLENLASAYQAAKKLPQAIELYEHVRDVRVKKLGALHLDTLKTLSNLASAYQTGGKLPEAIELLEKVRDAQVTKLGASHPDTLRTLHNLAWAYQAAKKLPQAIELYERAHDGQVKKLGALHPDTYTTLNKLAGAYRVAKKLPELIKLLEKLRDARVKEQGADHPDTVRTLTNLGNAYREAGKLPQALEVYNQVRDTLMKKPGADDPRTLTALNNLAGAYQAAGNLPRAIELLELVRDTLMKKPGPEDPRTLAALNNLAAAYHVAGKMPQAIELLEQVRDTLTKKLRPEDPSILTALDNLARAYMAAQKLPQATELFEQLRDAKVKKLGLDHPGTLATLANLAMAYLLAEKLTQAIELAEQARDAHMKKWGPDHPGTLAALDILALAYQKAGRLPEAIELFEQVRDAHMKKWGPDHPGTLATLNNLASAYQDAGKLPQALALFEHTATVIEKQNFRNEQAVLNFNVTAAAYAVSKQFDKAEVWQRKSLAIAKQINGVESSDYADGSFLFGFILLHKKKYTEAEPILRENLNLFAKLLPKNQGMPWQLAYAKSMLGEALLGQKKYVEAEPLLIAGYEGLKLNEKAISEKVRLERMSEAIQRLIDFAAATNKGDDLQKWQDEKKKYSSLRKDEKTAVQPPPELAEFFRPPEKYRKDLGSFRSPLRFADGALVNTPRDWPRRRAEILDTWHKAMGPWPALIDNPKVETIKISRRDNITQHQLRLGIALGGEMVDAFLLVPDGPGPFPAVVVVFYDAQTGVGLGTKQRDYGWQLAKRGFIVLSIGKPNAGVNFEDSKKARGGPYLGPAGKAVRVEPLSALAYLAANAHAFLARRADVKADRIGIVGHSFGGKWALFASCLYEPFACAVWSDPGIVFDERNRRKENPGGSVNYWDVWYLGFELGDIADPLKAGPFRKLPSEGQGRTGAYKKLVEGGHDLVELHALMAPRPFLVSGGTADMPERWPALNHAIAVNRLLGFENRVAMTNRKEHGPSERDNEQVYRFFQWWLQERK